MYDPVSSVTALRLTPVAVCVAVTSTPGRTAPLWSLTEPLICAVACAQINVAPKQSTIKAKTLRQLPIDFRIIDSLLGETIHPSSLQFFSQKLRGQYQQTSGEVNS